MFLYILKRLMMSLIVVLVAMVFLVSLVHLIPGDPVKLIMGPRAIHLPNRPAMPNRNTATCRAARPPPGVPPPCFPASAGCIGSLSRAFV